MSESSYLALYRRRKSVLAWTFIPLLAFAGCSGAAAQALAGTKWRLLSIGELTLPADTDTFIQFEAEGRASGFAGCNRFFGSYQESEGTIRIYGLGTTRKLCAEEVMELETAMLQALETARSFELRQTELTLYDEERETLARFEQQTSSPR